MFLVLSPNKWDALLHEVKQRLCNVREVLYEVPVKVTEPKEGLNVLDGSWYWPIDDASYLGMVHLDLSFRQYDSQIFDGGLHKGALLWLEVEIKLL